MERNRVLAQLDLPRPEMILSAWVTQNSTTSPEAIGAFSNLVKKIVSDYNDEYEKVILRAWFSLKQQKANPDYFNEGFRSYIADRFIADTYKDRKIGGSLTELSQAFLDQSQTKMADPVPPAKRTSLGICERRRYCLGYSGLFKRGDELQDSESESGSSSDNVNLNKLVFTDLLFAIIAAQDPVKAAEQAIESVQEKVPDEYAVKDSDNGGSYCDRVSTRYIDGERVEVRKRCQAIWRNLDLDHVSPAPQTHSCEDVDFRGILGSLLTKTPDKENSDEPRVYLDCFRRTAILLFGECNGTTCEDYRGNTFLPNGITFELFTKQLQQNAGRPATSEADSEAKPNGVVFSVQPLLTFFLTTR